MKQVVEDDGEGGECGHMPAEEFAADHLDADEAEECTETVVEEPEAVGDVGEPEAFGFGQLPEVLFDVGHDVLRF